MGGLVEDHAECNSAMLGSMMIACKTVGIDPAPLISGSNPVYLDSATALHSQIQAMVVENRLGHICNPIVHAQMLAMDIIEIEEMPSPVTQIQREHMKKQKSISGWNRQCN